MKGTTGNVNLPHFWLFTLGWLTYPSTHPVGLWSQPQKLAGIPGNCCGVSCPWLVLICFCLILSPWFSPLAVYSDFDHVHLWPPPLPGLDLSLTFWLAFGLWLASLLSWLITLAREFSIASGESTSFFIQFSCPLGSSNFPKCEFCLATSVLGAQGEGGVSLGECYQLKIMWHGFPPSGSSQFI